MFLGRLHRRDCFGGIGQELGIGALQQELNKLGAVESVGQLAVRIVERQGFCVAALLAK